MKVYPKVPRYDHPVVPDDFFEADDLRLVEKIDGSSFRFTLYDDRYGASYPEQVRAAANGDGSLVFGTRRQIRGSHDDPLDEIDGALHRAVRCLREGIRRDVLRELHEEVDSPVVVYAENLVYSTLDYGFGDRDLPALLGFDILPYTAIETMTPPGNPYDETFDRFLDTERAWSVFDRLGDPSAPETMSFRSAPMLEDVDPGFDSEAFEFPGSTLGENVTVEGVVVRSDERARRVKLVRESFQELNREQFGREPAEAETGAEYVVATYCTAGRIRKQIRKLVVEEGREFGLSLNETLYPRVVEDIWAENWRELMRLDRSLTPSEVYPLVADRCIAELRAMQTNAELNDVDPTEVWTHL
jgi:hypothetical protein